jgi:protein subunit release factor A
LEEVLRGDLDIIVDPLITYFQTEALKKNPAG